MPNNNNVPQTPLVSLGGDGPDESIFPTAAARSLNGQDNQQTNNQINQQPNKPSNIPTLIESKEQYGIQRFQHSNVDIYMYLYTAMKEHIWKHNKEVDSGIRLSKTSIRQFINDAIKEKIERMENDVV